MGSRGSIIPFFLNFDSTSKLPITDLRMTRFMISLEDGINLVKEAFEDMAGGEIYVKKIPSMKVTDIAKTILPNAKHEIIGIRPGEKIHEQMIGSEDSPFTFDYGSYFKILPAINDWFTDKKRIKKGIKVEDDFIYRSDTNTEWMTKNQLKTWIKNNQERIGKV